MAQQPTPPPLGPGSGAYPPPPPLGPGSGAYPPSPALGPGSGTFPPVAPQVAYVVKPRPKWHALRTVSAIYKIFAWITAGFGAIGVIVALVTGSQFGNFGFIGGLIFAIGAAIGAAIVFLGLYAYAEFILVLISIEENTRKF